MKAFTVKILTQQFCDGNFYVQKISGKKMIIVKWR